MGSRGERHGARRYCHNRSAVDAPERHLRLLTETIAAVNSSLDLEEVLGLVADKVAAIKADKRISERERTTQLAVVEQRGIWDLTRI